MKYQWIGFLLLFICACHKEPFYKHQRFLTRAMSSADTDVMLPSSLWDLFEKNYLPGPKKVAEPEEKKEGGEGGEGGHEGASKGGGEHGGGASASAGSGEHGGGGGGGGGGHGGGGAKTEAKGGAQNGELPMGFSPIRVFIYEKTKGVLEGNDYELVFGKGGGSIDLKDFVSNRKGTYHFAIEVEGDFDPKSLHVYYLSNAVKRQMDGRSVGAGCGKYMEITDYFKSMMKERGFELNTIKRLDLSVLAGTLFFVTTVGDELQLAQLTIKDSRYKLFHCNKES